MKHKLLDPSGGTITYTNDIGRDRNMILIPMTNTASLAVCIVRPRMLNSRQVP